MKVYINVKLKKSSYSQSIFFICEVAEKEDLDLDMILCMEREREKSRKEAAEEEVRMKCI